MSSKRDFDPVFPGLAVDRRSALLGGSAALLCAGTRPGTGHAAPADPQPSAWGEAFDRPPPEAGPGVYWYWLDGAVSAAGITADLEGMHANGITTAMVFAIGASAKPRWSIRPPMRSRRNGGA
jgi:hypothetical protein